MKLTKLNRNLVPDRCNPTPDYYCTWQTQLYATCDGKPALQRRVIGEKGLFSQEKPYGWAYFYEQARSDLLLVMDDSWDVPPSGDTAFYGSLIPDAEKFPEATRGAASNSEALKRLTERVKALGWKGMGGWICAQEAPAFSGKMCDTDYWRLRLREAEDAGFSYWKVDWGKRGTSLDFRRMLTALGREIAPHLTIEHAVIPSVIPYADVYRTYDVPAILSIPMTMQKLKEFLSDTRTELPRMGLLNCEDEAYIAAAGGFSMGIMRHPYAGAFINGKDDMSFPAVHRNLKTKICEITRAVRWHRIAPAFGIDAANVQIDAQTLTDTWHFASRDAEMEAWWFDQPAIRDHMTGERVSKTAPARVARGCALPEVIEDANGNVPFVVAAKNPNGAFSVVTAGRTLERTYEIPLCRVTLRIEDAQTVGVFGEYEELILETSRTHISHVWMQDLAGEEAFDITDDVCIRGGSIQISGALIHAVGTMAQPEGDTSEPGVLIVLG